MENKSILIGAGIATAAVVGLGLYVYFNNQEEEGATIKIMGEEEILENLTSEIKTIIKPAKISTEEGGNTGKHIHESMEINYYRKYESI